MWTDHSIGGDRLIEACFTEMKQVTFIGPRIITSKSYQRKSVN